MNLTTIKINNAKFYAYHGVYDHEKEYGNLFELDIELLCDLEDLKKSADLRHTVNYLSVYNLVKEIFNNQKFKLIETAIFRICNEILVKFDRVMKVTVRIRKPNAPLGILDSVEIEHSEERH